MEEGDPASRQPGGAGPGQDGAYLLDGRVLDGVGIVMVVDDFKVPHGLTLGSASKLHVQLGLARSLGQHREVSGLPHFHTWGASPTWW